MSAIFISHSSRDNDVAREVQQWLEQQGHRSVFLDFDPESGIVAGQDWEQTLYRNIKACRAVIVLCSVASMGSKWCFTEITHARAMGKELFPVRIDDCQVEGVFSDRQVVDFAEGKEQALERLRIGLMAAGLDPADAFDWDNSRPPYPGLHAFDEKDAAIYFGRDDEIRTGLDRLGKIHRLGSTAMLMVLGASGTGKSSLVRAGLIPRLRKDSDRWIVLDPLRPHDRVIPAVSHVLARAFQDVGRPMPAGVIERMLTAALEDVGPSDPLRDGDQAPSGRIAYGGDANPLLQLAEELRFASGRDEARTLMIIDQFEELFGDPSGTRSDFLALVRHAVERQNAPLVVLGTMRSDFLGSLQEDPALIHLDGESLSLGPMPPSGLLDMIVKPAALASIELDEGLTAALVTDAQGGGTLPLLAFTLHQMHQRFAGDNVLDVSEYRDQLGGLSGSIAKVANELVHGVSPEDTEALRRAFVKLTRRTEDGVFTRRPRRRDEMPESVSGLLDSFIKNGLLVTKGDGDEATIEVAHEALFTSWGMLEGWLSQSDEALRLQHDIEVVARRWAEDGKLPEYLWSGGRLERSRELITSRDLELPELDLEFVEASEAAERAKVEAEARRRTRVLQGVTAGLIVALVLGALAAVQWRTAVRAAERAAAARLTTVAAASTENQTELAMLTSVASLGITPTPNGWSALSAALVQPILARSPLEGHLAAVSGLAMSPDGSRLASTDWDGSVRIWDAATGDLLGEAPDEGSPLWANAVAFSPDGAMLAVGGFDASDARPDGFGGIWLHDAATGELLGEPLTQHTDEVLSLAFSPDGSHLVAADLSGEVLLWDLTAGPATAMQLFESSDNRSVGPVAFHPDGSMVVVGGSVEQSGLIWRFDAATGAPIDADGGVAADAGGVLGLAFSPDGRLLASVGFDGTLTLLSGDGSSFVGFAPVGGSNAWGNAVGFAPDGRRLATANSDGTVSLFELVPQVDFESGEEILVPELVQEPLNAHRGETLTVAAGAEMLYTGGADNRIARYDLDSGQSIGRRLMDQDVWSWTGFVAEGSLIGSVGYDDALQLWDVANGAPAGDAVYVDEDFFIGAAALSQDARLLVAIGGGPDDFTASAVLVDAESGQQVGEALAGIGNAGWAAFSPDGVHLAVEDVDTATLTIWDLRLGPAQVGLVEPGDFVQWLGFSPDGSLILSSDFDGTLRRWDVETGAEVGAPLTGHRAGVNAVAFAPDGRTMASASSDKTVRLWDLEADEQMGEALQGHGGQVFTVAFSPDGTSLASAGQDTTVVIRRVDDADNPVSLSGHQGQVGALAFMADGSAVVSLDENGTIREWPMPGAWQDLACRAAGRNLTLEEWDSIVGGDRAYERQCADLPPGEGAGEDARAVVVEY